MSSRLVDLLQRFGSLQSGLHHLTLDDALYADLVEQAAQADSSPENLAAELIASGLALRRGNARLHERWENLSPRGRDVVALSCLGCTNRQAAARLGISPETVSWYVRRALVRLGVRSKAELQVLFKGWDFSRWGPPADR